MSWVGVRGTGGDFVRRREVGEAVPDVEGDAGGVVEMPRSPKKPLPFFPDHPGDPLTVPPLPSSVTVPLEPPFFPWVLPPPLSPRLALIDSNHPCSFALRAAADGGGSGGGMGRSVFLLANHGIDVGGRSSTSSGSKLLTKVTEDDTTCDTDKTAEHCCDTSNEETVPFCASPRRRGTDDEKGGRGGRVDQQVNGMSTEVPTLAFETVRATVTLARTATQQRIASSFMGLVTVSGSMQAVHTSEPGTLLSGGEAASRTR